MNLRRDIGKSQRFTVSGFYWFPVFLMGFLDFTGFLYFDGFLGVLEGIVVITFSISIAPD